MKTISILRAAVFLAVLAASASRVPAAETVFEQNVEIPMRDGVILRANVIRPAEEGIYPVLVQQTPYGKGDKPNAFARLAADGYIIVTVDVRGRYASEGTWRSFVRPDVEQEHRDGYDTVQWAAKMKGSSGKVGLIGTSYPAYYQWRTAAAQPPALGAMAAFSIPPHHNDLEGPGSIRPGRRLVWFIGGISPDLRRRGNRPGPQTPAEAFPALNAGEASAIIWFLPWSELPRSVFEDEYDAVQAWLAAPHTNPYRLDTEAERTLVPNLNVCGWFDHCNGSIDLHTAIVESGGSDAARNQSRLIIGPWSHSGLGQRRKELIDFGPDDSLDLIAEQKRWFDHWLKGQDTGILQDPRVRLFVLGENRWHSFSQWPPSPNRQEVLFLRSGGRANTPAGDGRLDRETTSTSGYDRYLYDPRNPVPTLWTAARFTDTADQSPLRFREDILVYQSEPLEKPLCVIGYPQVELHAASSAPDTDFFVRLIDVAPDGSNYDLCAGVVRARYRDGLERPKLLEPGSVVKYTIRMRPTAVVFQAGHRIRLDITSSDFPNFDRNHNTAADQYRDPTLVTAEQTIYHGGNTASQLVLPIVRLEP